MVDPCPRLAESRMSTRLVHGDPIGACHPQATQKVSPVKYVGIDVHKMMCQVAVIDEDGTPLDEIRFRNEALD